MRITASKKDDILKRKTEFEAENARRKAIHEDQRRAYRSAEHEVFSGIESIITRYLDHVDLDLDIQCDTRMIRSGSSYTDVIVVRVTNDVVRFSDDETISHYEDPALRWNWSVYVNAATGEVVKDSGSWSGLKATTADQLYSLKQSVAALEVLNQIDWVNVLNVELPKYEDYFTEDGIALPKTEDFDQELIEAEIEDIVGTKTAIKLYEGDMRRKRFVWAVILKETPKQYKVAYIQDYTIELAKQDDTDLPYSKSQLADSIEHHLDYGEGITKSKFTSSIVHPIETLDIEKFCANLRKESR